MGNAKKPEKKGGPIIDEAFAEIAACLIDHQRIEHPLPWRIERDWTHEVTASDGCIVAKCRTQELAELIILYANKRAGEFDQAMSDLLEKDVNDDERVTPTPLPGQPDVQGVAKRFVRALHAMEADGSAADLRAAIEAEGDPENADLTTVECKNCGAEKDPEGPCENCGVASVYKEKKGRRR